MLLKKLLLAVSALTLFSVAAVADPTDDALDAVLAKLKASDMNGALADLDRITVLTPAQQVRTRYYRAYAWYRTGESERAITELRAFLPDDNALSSREAFVQTGGVYGEKARGLLGTLYLNAGQFEKLPELYLAMTKDYPQNPEWGYLYADALFKTRLYSQAAEAYGQYAIQHTAGSRLKEAKLRKEEALRMAGRYEEAYLYLTGLDKPDVESEIRIDVRRAELLVQFLGRDHQLSNRLCEDLIAKYPEHPVVFLARCRLARNLLYDLPPKERDYGKARAMLRNLISRYPTEGMMLEMKVDVANSYLYEKDYTNAIAHYELVLSEYPDQFPKDNWHAFIRYQRAFALNAKGNWEQAVEAWKEMVSRYPADPWAALAKQRLEKVGIQ